MGVGSSITVANVRSNREGWYRAVHRESLLANRDIMAFIALRERTAGSYGSRTSVWKQMNGTLMRRTHSIVKNRTGIGFAHPHCRFASQEV